jgi:hypothetical protein
MKYSAGVQVADLLAIALTLTAVTAFLMGERDLARANDLEAIYWLAVGVVSLRAAVQVGRPGARA